MIRPNLFELTRPAARSFNVAACALALASCATVTRIPYTQHEQAAAVIPGIPGARIWADDPAIATVRRSVVSRVPAKQQVVLALSGGSQMVRSARVSWPDGLRGERGRNSH